MSKEDRASLRPLDQMGMIKSVGMLQGLDEQIKGDLNIADLSHEKQNNLVRKTIREIFQELLSLSNPSIHHEKSDIETKIENLCSGGETDEDVEDVVSELISYFGSIYDDYERLFWQSYQKALLTAQGTVLQYRHSHWKRWGTNVLEDKTVNANPHSETLGIQG